MTVVLGIGVFEQFGVDGENATETAVWIRSVWWFLD